MRLYCHYCHEWLDITSVRGGDRHYACEESANSAGEGHSCDCDYENEQNESTTENKSTNERDPRSLTSRKESQTDVGNGRSEWTWEME